MCIRDSCNTRATNEYRNRNALAYCVNRFLNPDYVKYFAEHGVEIDQDMFALSEMIQWIWRSAIREGKPIPVSYTHLDVYKRQIISIIRHKIR